MHGFHPVLEFFTEPLSFPFMQRAMLEIIIVGALCGLVGSFVVLRGLAFIGDALAHAVFPGVVLSYAAGHNIMLGASVFGLLTALGIGLISRSKRLSHDSAIGVIFAAFFALGVVLLSRQTGFRQDLGSLLFGNILGVSRQDVLITFVVGLVIVAVVFLLLKELTLVAFDTNLAHSTGYPVFTLDIILLLLVSTTVVVSLQTVGNLLILALLVTPAATARLLTDRLNTMFALSVAIAIISGVIGLYISFHWSVAAGGAIVLTATVLFAVALVFAPQHGLLSQQVHRRQGKHHVHHFHAEGEDLEVH
jgi:manganese/iron transport system permease protein